METAITSPVARPLSILLWRPTTIPLVGMETNVLLGDEVEPEDGLVLGRPTTIPLVGMETVLFRCGP
jgi:hypothetical protein